AWVALAAEHLPLLSHLAATLLAVLTFWRVSVVLEVSERCARLVVAPTVRPRVVPSLPLHLQRRKVAVAIWHWPWRLLCRCASLVLLEVMMKTRLTMRTGTI
ncbi:hypothetical protein BGZ47_003907, partial [Haplosporangium gracile]